MEQIAELVKAIAQLLWPIAIIVIFCFSRNEIRDLLIRLRIGKVAGLEIQLEKSLNKLTNQAEDVASELKPLLTTNDDSLKTDSERSVIQDILKSSILSPITALLQLSSEIEKEIMNLIASNGWINQMRSYSLNRITEELNRRGAITNHIYESLLGFRQVRNQLVHGGKADAANIMRAIDSGITILGAIQTIPREINIVYHPGVDIYSDKECGTKREGVRGLILETISPGGAIKSKRIFPTTKMDYIKGKRLTWEWSNSLECGDSWYKDPDTNEIMHAWTESYEFVGKYLDG